MSQKTPKKEAPKETPQSVPSRKNCPSAKTRRTMDVHCKKMLFEPCSSPTKTLDGPRSAKRRISRAWSVSPPPSPVQSIFSSDISPTASNQKTPGYASKRDQTKTISKYQARRALTQFDLKKASHFTKNDFVRISRLINDNKDAADLVFARVISISSLKRRAELKHLEDEIANEKEVNIKERNHLNVLKTHFSDEQSRSADLKHQLKAANAKFHTLNMNCVKLTTSIIEAKSDKSVVEQQLEVTETIIAKLSDQLSQVKLELSEISNQENQLRTDLTAMETVYNSLFEENEKFMCEMQDLNIKLAQQQKLYEALIKAEKESLTEIHGKASILKEALAEQEQQKKQNMNTEMKLVKEKETLSAEIDALQFCLDHTIDKRITVCCKNTVRFKNTALELMHWVIANLLPAVPPPKPPKVDFPIGMTLHKALTYAKA